MSIFNFTKNKEQKVIIGIISSKGSSGGRGQGQELWNFSFNLEYWYTNNSQINTENLRVTKNVQDVELRKMMNKAVGETVVKILYTGDIINGKVEFDSILDYNFYDSKLQPYIEDIRKDIIYNDNELGNFILNKSVDTYCCILDWCGIKAELVMETNEEIELVDLIEKYKERFTEQMYWNTKVKKFASKELISLKNDSWLEDDEKEMSELEFQSSMSLESLVLYTDDSYTFWYNDGDLFGGHVIIVEGNLDDGLLRAEIAG
ncbi:DUF2262 domain-containing protein [Vallitalea guaymasensis]|uniref:DUF2262 domain-containing protein n=1 Tax=Vallitalea guaymasensis TaxID=1185412 RepID=A0A8J8M8Y7_9FIRM|nr:DUF2262 domain-containing protein [Vallitalea guaymasensis]QUH28503.1 DUF2262 domain-containing protein [Vallitalea guaymasensis]